MINLLKKFKKALSNLDKAVIYKTSNYVHITDSKIKIRIGQNSYISDLFDPLDNFTCYKYVDLLKGKMTVLNDTLSDNDLLTEFLNIPCLDNLYSLPKVKIECDNSRDLTNNAFIADGYLYFTNGVYMLRHDLEQEQEKDSKLNIPGVIWNIFSKFDCLKIQDNMIQVFGYFEKNVFIAIEYKKLFNVDSCINMIKSVSKCLDTCTDGAIFDLTELYKLKLPAKRADNLIKVVNGMLSIKNLTFNHTKELKFDYELKDKNFAIDYCFVNKFKKLFQYATLKTFSTLSQQTHSISLQQGNNALILACFKD